MSPIKKLTKQVTIYGLSSVLARVLNFLLTPLYTGVFLAKDYVVIIDVYSQISIFIILLTYGMETAYFRFSNESKYSSKTFSTAFLSIVFTTVLFVFITLCFLDGISQALGYENQQKLVIYLIVILTIDSVTAIPFAKLRHENKAFKYALIKITNIVIYIFVNVLFLWAIPDFLSKGGELPYFISRIYNPQWALEYVFISNILSSAISLFLLSKDIGQYSIKMFDFKLLKKMITYGAPILVMGLAGVINEAMDKQFLKYLLPEDQWRHSLGVYGACYKLSIFMVLFIQAYRLGAEPIFFSQSKNKDSKKLYATTMNYFVLTMLIIFLLLVTHIELIKYFIRSEEYWQALDIVPILLLAQVFFGIYTHLSVWYKLSDKTVYGAYMSIVGAIITIVGNISLIPIIGYAASAWTTLFSYGAMMILSLYLGNKYYPIKYDFKKISMYFILTVLPSMYSWFFLKDNIFSNTLLFLVFLSVLVVIHRKEVRLIISGFKSPKSLE
ncbi:lipopolysaccharide biosynthesis protein [Ichthyobacterium seriolicida]|uniref:Polysaccharide biosynthesis protein n=1 Tax=Ichthyobacterium seriolicida TaxID=242600 RepID=A0A1J1E4S1_9FLAO|nr:polysaccharide biosynthesis C-terminal domain-containing protein [Ichthyobacterium seriolicida]BAV94318.1 polysaccharide biosynthesis protein [Ichthyobacterium seriolicida]